MLLRSLACTAGRGTAKRGCQPAGPLTVIPPPYISSMPNRDTDAPRWGEILAFLPELESPDFVAEEVCAPEGQFPFYSLSETGGRLMVACYQAGIMVDFDWTKWEAPARELMQKPRALEQADLLTLRKLLTGHLRNDRFCEGHFGEVLESGHIAAILRRVAYLLGAGPQSGSAPSTKD